MQFDFGQNWTDFSRSALTGERVEAAQKELAALLEGVPLRDATFLDVGFGQGLSLLGAARSGSRVIGCDINPKCREALRASAAWFPEVELSRIPIVTGSILDAGVLDELRSLALSENGSFDVIHSWGVLHHTGNMRLAIHNAASLVRPGGHLILAIYNRHWSSPVWTLIKWLYCKAPRWIQRLLVSLFVPVIWLAKRAVTGRDPAQKTRGMDFHYDVIDWVGGYPYEYASIAELRALVEPLGFACLRSRPAEVPTGCNEFVFRRL